MTAQQQHAPVVIVGAGPVGMTTALDLAKRGVDVIIVEKKAKNDAPRQRCNHISAKTLEIFRRLGVADEIRNAGLPADYPQDISYVTSLNGHELTRIRIPARKDRFGTDGYADSGWPTPEPPHRCNQMFFEPILQRHMLASPRIRAYFSTEVETVEQDEQGVRIAARHTGTGAAVHFAADYLVGCDGGSSMVRKAIGGRYEGDEVISGTRSVVARVPGLRSKMKVDPAWMTWFVNPRAFGCVVALNGDDLWAFHFWLPAGMPDFDAVDPVRSIPEAVGAPVAFEIQSVDDWYGRRLVSSRFRRGRMFTAGDASHIWIPFAGYGMNAGIADAMDLSWQLAATINGWGGPDLLDAYEAERRPITLQVSREVMSVALKNIDIEMTRNPPPLLEQEGPDADAARAKAGQYFHDVNVGQFACIGINFGSYFEHSPIIAYDGEHAPPYSISDYRPSTVPGCRTPHVWMADGASLYDRMGPEFTLLRTDPAISVEPLLAAARARGLPLAVVEIGPDEAQGLYDRPLVLSRPDQHIAWRGESLPDDVAALLDKVAGGPARQRAGLKAAA
jgi:2-polyprenyl-6-methoxyphenol hydroxylase-like FAD-dependent oxidoreductase